MAVDASNVLVAVTGAVYSAATATTAPTSQASSLSAWDDLGLVSEEGVVLDGLPGAGDAKTIHAWQNGQAVRTVRTPSDSTPSLKFRLLETNINVIETVLGVTVSQTATEGAFEIDTNDVRTALSFAVDVVDGSELIRIYAPKGIVTSVGAITLTHTGEIAYEVTVECDRDNTKSYNLKSWMTKLKTP